MVNTKIRLIILCAAKDGEALYSQQKQDWELTVAQIISSYAEFQGITRRDKKAFLSDQCKEIEENNRMGKTIDLFKKIRDTKGTFHAKMGSIKDRNGMDQTEAEDIKKKWQEYTKNCTKKIFTTQIITMV